MEQLLTLDDAERLAESVVAPEAWSYIVGGAGDERTLRWNREAFSRYRLRYRVLVDVSAVSDRGMAVQRLEQWRAAYGEGHPLRRPDEGTGPWLRAPSLHECPA